MEPLSDEDFAHDIAQSVRLLNDAIEGAVDAGLYVSVNVTEFSVMTFAHPVSVVDVAAFRPVVAPQG